MESTVKLQYIICLSDTCSWRMEEEGLTKEPAVAYILTPACIASLSVTLLFEFVIYPFLIPALVPGYNFKSLGNKGFDILLSSTIHAVVASSLSCCIFMFGALGTGSELLKSPLGLAKTPLEFTALQISLGYYVADSFVRLQHPNWRKYIGLILHHVLVVIGLVICLDSQGIYAFFLFFRFVTELAIPFLNIVRMFHVLGPRYQNGPWYHMVLLGQIISYFCFHILLKPLFWYQLLPTIVHPSSVIVPLVLRVLGCICLGILDVMDVYWFIRMTRGALYGI